MGYTARTLLVVRWQKCADCSGVKPTRVIKRTCTERVEAVGRLPAYNGRLEGMDTSHGRKDKQGLNAWKESSGTNPDSSAYYGGPWETCIFEIKKNPDLSIVQENIFQIDSI